MGSNRNGPLSGSWARMGTHAVAETVGDTNAEGSSEALARADHVHDHGDQIAGTFHPIARRDMEDDASDTDGFLSAYYDARHRRIAQATVDYGATTMTATHMPVPTLVANALTARQSTRGDFVQLDTTAVSGNAATMLTTAFFQRRMEAAFCHRLRTGNLTSTRVWVGMWSADPSGTAPAGIAGAGIHMLGFCYDSVTDVTARYLIIASDGVTQVAVDSGIGVASSSNIAFEIQCDDLSTDEVRFYINGALVATITTPLPTASQALMCGSTITAQAAIVRNYRPGIITLTKAG